MNKIKFRPMTRLACLAVTAGLSLSAVALPVAPVRVADRSASIAAGEDWRDMVWKAAVRGDERLFTQLIEQAPADLDPSLAASIESYREGLASREQKRAEAIEKVEKDLAEHLDAETEADLSEALVAVLTLQTLTEDMDGVLGRDDVRLLVSRAEQAARLAELESDWLHASELFYRLDKLFEESSHLPTKYRGDVERLNRRLSMISMYNPERLWELRNERRIEDGGDPLPPYNDAGNDYRDRLDGVGTHVLLPALEAAARDHVDRVDVRTMIIAGLDALETLATTTDVYKTFPGLTQEPQRRAFLSLIREDRDRVRDMRAGAPRGELASVIARVRAWNRDTIGLPDAAVIHEFGNGAMSALDDFSAIIWPDELERFRRSTNGSYTGVGIQIQHDEQQRISVVTPLEGTPAHRAGIRAGDLIVAVNGASTLGFTLTQAVEQITGPVNSEVILGIERTIENDAGETETVTLDVPVQRMNIQIQTVKGWERTGAREDDWNWFIDAERGIGYIRLTQFTDATSRDFDRAIADMKRSGLNGLVLDLRFNPGGLLNEAVTISDRFVSEGAIVSTRDRNGIQGETRSARPTGTTLADIPVIALINEGSASASEIVSGAIRDHARMGDVDALILGRRSFGKGSVQNVWPLPGRASAMKLTTQYYLLPSGDMIHRRPGATQWGVEPDLEVEMLPSQVADAILLRRDADVLPIDENGILVDAREDRPNPNDLITEGIDLQLQTALVLLQSRVSADIARTSLNSN
ncbi:MAG: S41 family peptidase [Phycisphaerales bacterium JB037]